MLHHMNTKKRHKIKSACVCVCGGGVYGRVVRASKSVSEVTKCCRRREKPYEAAHKSRGIQSWDTAINI